MSQERIEAATKAIIGENVIDADDDLFTVWMHEIDEHAGTVTEVATRALAAADAALFSDEAIERAARAIWALHGKNPEDWVYIAPEDNRKAFCMDHARAVVTALKGEA